MGDETLDLFAARQERDEVLTRWGKTVWVKNAREIAVRICRERGEVTADDVWEEVPHKPSERRAMGAVFNNKVFEKVGYTQTKRKEAHARPIAVFRLREEAA